MSDVPSLRISDEEREQAASELREHYAQGRIDGDELGERLDRAYAARTASELEAVRRDLPALRAGRGEVAERRAQLTRQLVQNTGAGLVPFIICTLVWLFSGANGSFWPAWALLIAVIPLVRNGWHLYGPAPDLDRVEQELAEHSQRRRGLPPPPPPPH